MDSREQTRQWVNGISIHNEKSYECCPDFSCCVPDLLASEADRKKYYIAELVGDGKFIRHMLSKFLGRLIAHAGLDGEVH